MKPSFRTWIALLIVLLSGALAAQAETYAVIVGINTYRSPVLRRLRYAENDAAAINEVLTRYANVKPENIRLLMGAQASRREIATAIKGWLAERAGPDDTAFFYFSGHGTYATDTDGDEEDGRDELLSAWDSALLDISYVRDDDLNRWLSVVPARTKIVFIDACFSGTGSKSIYQGNNTVKEAGIDWYSMDLATPAQARAAEREIDDQIRRENFSPQRIAVLRAKAAEKTEILEFAASRPDEVSMEAQSLQHGVFTYFVLEGIRGAADQNGDGDITLGELWKYTVRNVKELGFEQHAQLSGKGSADYRFVSKSLKVEPVAADVQDAQEVAPEEIESEPSPHVVEAEPSPEPEAPPAQISQAQLAEQAAVDAQEAPTEEVAPSSPPVAEIEPSPEPEPAPAPVDQAPPTEQTPETPSAAIETEPPSPPVAEAESSPETDNPQVAIATSPAPPAQPEIEGTPPPELALVLPRERVEAVDEDVITLNIGSSHGVVTGAIYRVYPWKRLVVTGGRIPDDAIPSGVLRIESVSLAESRAVFADAPFTVAVNDAVKLYQRPLHADPLYVRVIADEGEAKLPGTEALLSGIQRGVASLPNVRTVGREDIADRLIVGAYDVGGAGRRIVRIALADPALGRATSVYEAAASDSIEATVRAAMRRLKPLLDAAFTRKTVASLQNPDSPIRLRLSGPEHALIGHHVTFQVTPNHDSYLFVVNVATDGALYVLFPNSLAPDNRVKAGETVTIPNGDWRVRVAGPPGVEIVKVIATTDPINLGSIDLDDLRAQRMYALTAEQSGKLMQRVALDVLDKRPVATWAAEGLSFTVSEEESTASPKKEPRETRTLQ